MFDYLKGTLTHIAETYVAIDVQGVGYKVLTPPTKDKPLLNDSITVFTHLIFRDPDMILFGFFSRQDRELFELLIGISGIGPKTALNIIGHLPLAHLQTAVLSKNTETFSKIPGIGKKTAERLILELKNKFSDLPLPEMHDPQPSSLYHDALNALTNLGYSSAVAQKAISATVKDHTTLSSLISAALKVIK